MPDSLASAQFPGRVAHICTQAELNALLSPASPSQSTSNFDDTTAFRLPAPRSGPKQEFISGSKKDLETLGRNFKSTFVGLAGHVRSSCHSWSSYSEEYQRHIDVFSRHVILSSAAFQTKFSAISIRERTGHTETSH
ncbi:hypothetical protein BS47DRAFT_1486312 [Hydnum rufescens UP504]|uniref:Uncharacterized protein n=1 Tax=Hydnum rufescens UP504 TaxID=1448309 RepID=A0A9P6DSP9_9AGAM|nr:hypothetical protein BS47DRAFT_1486312 [Hydnum rufescens UP504]